MITLTDQQIDQIANEVITKALKGLVSSRMGLVETLGDEVATDELSTHADRLATAIRRLGGLD